jgi:hypothetical protein
MAGVAECERPGQKPRSFVQLSRARRYSTVSVPTIPASRWPGTLQ